MKITICGGGNLGHVCAGYFSSQLNNEVSLLTTKPEAWSHRVDVVAPEGIVYHGFLCKISDKAQDVIPNADMVLLCLPGFALKGVLTVIMPLLSYNTWVGTVVSSTVFFMKL